MAKSRHVPSRLLQDGFKGRPSEGGKALGHAACLLEAQLDQLSGEALLHARIRVRRGRFRRSWSRRSTLRSDAMSGRADPPTCLAATWRGSFGTLKRGFFRCGSWRADSRVFVWPEIRIWGTRRRHFCARLCSFRVSKPYWNRPQKS